MAKKGTKGGNDGPIGAVMVVGGGISGMQSALDLADSGFLVYLVDNKPTIGGTMAQLDKTFPTNDCSMCIMAPKLVATGRHPNIVIIPDGDVRACEGGPGHFKVTVSRHARRVDPDRCTGCGICAQKCPVRVDDSYQEGTMRRAAIYVDYPQAVPLVYTIDEESCIGCGVCEGECPADAVLYDDEEQDVTIEVGSVILSPGFDEFDPSVLSQYGYGRHPNVVTSIEFERLLSASGPYRGMVLRPSDGDIPSKVAFLQCVGSRDDTVGAPFCSSVCCMYSIKEAIIAEEHSPGLKAHIFFMDVRAFGKEFDEYVNRAVDEFGIQMNKHVRVPALEEVPGTENLVLSYERGDELVEEEFDMVVLAVGLHAPATAQHLAEVFQIELNDYAFALTGPYEPLSTSRPGVFVSGAFSGPKDIPTTVAEASGAAAKAQEVIATARGELVTVKELVPERDISGEKPRIGVFVCHCGINIGGVVDVPGVAEYARTLPGVVYSEDNLYTCSQDTQERMKEKIAEHGLNRVIVASCTPRTHEPLFRNTVREAGLNPYLFEMANIRDQCSWVHMHVPEAATEKAKDLVRMVGVKALSLQPLETMKLSITKAALVMGGGVSGMTAALSIARQGFRAYLVERERALGGNLRHLRTVLEGGDPQEMMAQLVRDVNEHPLVEALTGTEVESISGFVGNFETALSGREEAIEHGVVVIATGGSELKPEGFYMYGEDERVLTQQEFEDELSRTDLPPGPVVMIQCVGSRIGERPYCSRVCCTTAIKNAIRIREVDPEQPVYILYRDIRTYGFREVHYRRAAELGVTFIRFADDKPPEVSAAKDGLRVLVEDMTIGDTLELEAARLVLSAATLPRPDNEIFAKMLKVPLSKDGFFLEAHMKLRPLDFASDGVFLCGMAHWPKFIDETIAQALGAASRAVTILSMPHIEAEGIVASVDEELCRGCGRCVEVCEYGAVALEEAGEGVYSSRVNEVLCKGCGACAVGCPTKAITVRHFTDDQLMAMVETMLQEVG